MPKSNIIYACNNCGHESPRWLGQCPSCSQWNTMVEFAEPNLEAELSKGFLQEIDLSKKIETHDRIPSGSDEFDRVLGGGFVKSQVILLSGEPGIGKSTILLQLLAKAAKTAGGALYVSAEESVEQVGMRAHRLFKTAEKLSVISAFEIETIIKYIGQHQPKVVVIDSIQTVFSNQSRGLPGSMSQVRAVAANMVKYAKENNLIVILVGQITKEGEIAGPKLLEHLVDTVLQLEGEEKTGFRLLRSQKNRFGTTNEVGIFIMTEQGMQDVADPAKFFITSDTEPRVGVCPAIILEGNRAIVLEVQALTTFTPYTLPKRVSEGVSKSKLEVIAAIINKYTKLNLTNKDIYVNIAGGIRVKDPGLDLAVAMAIISSAKEKALPKNIAAFGELSLTGRIRQVERAELRQKELKRLGYKTFESFYKDADNIAALSRDI